jgi:ABC-type hemin transport system ATPase subunit
VDKISGKISLLASSKVQLHRGKGRHRHGARERKSMAFQFESRNITTAPEEGLRSTSPPAKIGEYAGRMTFRLGPGDQSSSCQRQQKVIIARWLFSKARLLIMDEPTQGIDIGAKHEVYNVINELTGSGISIILISSDFPELLAISDRVAVVRDGRIVEITEGQRMTEYQLIGMASGADGEDTENELPGVIRRPEENQHEHPFEIFTFHSCRPTGKPLPDRRNPGQPGDAPLRRRRICPMFLTGRHSSRSYRGYLVILTGGSTCPLGRLWLWSPAPGDPGKEYGPAAAGGHPAGPSCAWWGSKWFLQHLWRFLLLLSPWRP